MRLLFWTVILFINSFCLARAQEISLPPMPQGMRGTPPDGNYDQIVDRFGQYTRAAWPGKLQDESDFSARLSDETRDLQKHPAPASFDSYGGWNKGPQLPAQKYFYTTQYQGKWWLVNPLGHLFFSLGMDAVRPNEPTFIAGREHMFSWLPTSDEPLAKFRSTYSGALYGPRQSGATFDFYQANLYRKYGTDYLQRWKEQVPLRLRSWGFNTIGNWSYLFHANGKMPYTATLSITGDHARLSSGFDYWGTMHDSFDPQFAANTQKAVQQIPAEVVSDPYCIGYFVDNELSWGAPGGLPAMRYGLAYSTLAQQAATSPAKRAFINLLKERYGGIASLNAAWATAFADWRDLDNPWNAPAQLSAEMREDFSAFLTAHAQKYFQVINDALKRADPNHLYLGCRFALPLRTPEAVAAADLICDAVSFNVYMQDISPALDFLRDLRKPSLIGEFHFGALDRGMFHAGMVSTANQQERAATFRAYVNATLRHPALIGAHWFKWSDQPLTGRPLDGENFAIGFVDVTDTPYPEMVDAARSLAEEMYAVRASAQ